MAEVPATTRWTAPAAGAPGGGPHAAGPSVGAAGAVPGGGAAAAAAGGGPAGGGDAGGCDGGVPGGGCDGGVAGGCDGGDGELGGSGGVAGGAGDDGGSGGNAGDGNDGGKRGVVSFFVTLFPSLIPSSSSKSLSNIFFCRFGNVMMTASVAPMMAAQHKRNAPIIAALGRVIGTGSSPSGYARRPRMRTTEPSPSGAFFRRMAPNSELRTAS